MTPRPEDREQARELLAVVRQRENIPGGTEDILQAFERALTQARANSAAMEWIPCSERMPEPEQVVIVATPRGVYLGGRHNSEKLGLRWFHPGSFSFSPSEYPTHWMQLPAPPEGAGP